MSVVNRETSHIRRAKITIISTGGSLSSSTVMCRLIAHECCELCSDTEDYKRGLNRGYTEHINYARAAMKYLHTMVRVSDLDESLDFYCNKLGLVEIRRTEVPAGSFTLVYLAAPGDESAQVELTWNWDSEEYTGGRNFGHLAYAVDDIYALCRKLMDAGVTINRPPRDGHMAFIRSPDGISVELLQSGEALPIEEPWSSMESTGSW